MKVLVYGGTGSQARPTVERLLEKGHCPVVITRNPENASDLAKMGANIVEGELSDLALLDKVSADVDKIAFLVPAFIGSADEAIALGRNAIDAAVLADVKRFVWNASGPIPGDSNPDDPKSVIFDYLQKSSLNWVVFEPSTYMENWLGPWTAPSVKESDELTYPVLDHVKIGWLASDDVGKLVVKALEDDSVANKRFEISGVEAPVGPELAEKFSEGLGRTIKYRAMTPEEMGAAIDGAFGPGSGDRIAELYRKEQADPDPEPKYHDMSGVLELLPVQMTTIVEWVKKHADKL